MLDTPVLDLGLSVRAHNCLRNDGIETVRDIIKRLADQGALGLMRIPNLGRRSWNEIAAKLDNLGVISLPPANEARAQYRRQMLEQKAEREQRELGTSVYLLKSQIEALLALDLPADITERLRVALPKVR